MEAQVLNLKRCEDGVQHAANNHRAQRTGSICAFVLNRTRALPNPIGWI